MAVKIAINGLGRIGRCVLRSYVESNRSDVEVVAINASGPIDNIIHLLQYDSTHGTFPKKITGTDNSIDLGRGSIQRFESRDPASVPWDKAGADIVLECTGKFKEHESASLYLKGGAKKVIISAPSPDPDAMIVYGVNENIVTPEDKIISIGSCTTNCLAPVAKLLNDAIGIESGFMTTIHAYTNDQNVLDGSHKDLRRARACGLSMIPTSTGAAKALGQVLPELDGKLDGTAIRVPTPNVSLVDFTFTASRDTSVSEINQLMEKASAGKMNGVLGYNTAPLVSIDFNRNNNSSIFDATQTYVLNNRFCRVAAWYDNEWGFSVRMLDVAAMLGNL